MDWSRWMDHAHERRMTMMLFALAWRRLSVINETPRPRSLIHTAFSVARQTPRRLAADNALAPATWTRLLPADYGRWWIRRFAREARGMALWDRRTLADPFKGNCFD